MTRRTLVISCVFLLIVEAAGLAFVRKHVGDFAFFYAVSKLDHEGKPDVIASPPQVTAVTEQVLGSPLSGGLYFWAYPPTARVLVYPLAWLPLRWALVAMMGAGLAAYLSFVLRIVAPRREALLAALAFPGVAITLGYGHISLFATALFGWGLALLPRQPLRAGALLGALAFKPQLGVMIPIALVAGRRWRAAGAAAASAIGFAAIATAVFGWRSWRDAFENASALGALLQAQSGTSSWMTSALALVSLAGGGGAVAWSAQAIVAAGGAAVLWWIWRGDTSPEVKAAALPTATLLATPYLNEYDLALLAVPIAFLVRDALSRGWLPGDRPVLIAAWIVPALVHTASDRLHLSPGPLVALALLGIVVRRARDRRLSETSLAIRQEQDAAAH